jgi:hypothetical protein
MRVLEEQPVLTTLILGPCTALTEVFISGLVLKIPSLTHLALAGCSLLVKKNKKLIFFMK